ncbi:MAG: hypothetical protein QOF51_3182 [Chloroflexota bacterium]|nr:hypothetical protein [Chloroflexota bacterium]
MLGLAQLSPQLGCLLDEPLSVDKVPPPLQAAAGRVGACAQLLVKQVGPSQHAEPDVAELDRSRPLDC